MHIYIYIYALLIDYIAIIGAITLTDVLDYELRQKYDLTLRAADTTTGSYSEAIVHVLLTVSYEFFVYEVENVNCNAYIYYSLSIQSHCVTEQ